MSTNANYKLLTDTTGQAIATAIAGLSPGLATSSQSGLMAPASYVNGGQIVVATTSQNGLMAATDKAKLEDSPHGIVCAASALSDVAAYHNSVYRGKNLGSSLTAAQSAQIQAGTFEDLFLGDYWVINGVTYIIAAFDYYYRTGDTELTTHHVVVIPAANMGDSQWYTSNDTSMGYVGSTIRANIKASGGAQATIISAFGSSHVLSWRALYPSTYSSGKATGWAWVDARVELMNETQVYGHQVWIADGSGNAHEDGVDKWQLPLFAVMPTAANIRANWWLRSVYSATVACIVSYYGYANYSYASGSIGVRPLALIA